MKALLTAACLALAARALGADARPSLLRGESLDATLKDAARAKLRFVLADVTTKGCAPCREMARTTWRDPAAAAFLKGRGLAVSVDGDMSNAPICRDRHISEFPTVLILRPDGSELDRLVGYQSTTDLIAGIQDALAGGSSVKRARARAAAAKDQDTYVQARFELAQVLMESGRNEESLADLLWLYDDGMKSRPEFTGVRASYLPAVLVVLGRRYPPAMAAVYRRFSQARQRLLGPDFTTNDAREYLALSRWTAKPGADLALFDSLRPSDPRRRVLAPMLFDDFLDKRRYDDAAAARSFKSAEQRLTECAARDWGKNAPTNAEERRMSREFCLDRAAAAAEAYAGAGQDAYARGMVARVRAACAEPWAEAILRRHLRRAGRTDILN